MIASLTGTVEHVGLDHLVVTVGGVGLRVHTTPTTASATALGAAVTLSTTLIVREDALTLYGFASRDEREMFETVQTVTGVGPRLALAMLSVMGPDEVRLALSTGDAKALTKVPGVGPKSAQRLVLELRDKVGRMPSISAGGTPSAPSSDTRNEQLVEALVGLGWSAKQAGDAVQSVATSAPTDADLATQLRLALRELRR